MNPKPVDYASYGSEPPRKTFARGVFGWVLFIGLSVFLFLAVRNKTPQSPLIAFSDFDLLLRSGSVKSVTIQGDEIDGVLSAGTTLQDGRNILSFRTIVPSGVGGTWPLLEYVNSNRHSAVVNVENSTNLLLQVFVPLIPWLLIFGFLWFFVFRQLRAAKLQHLPAGRQG